MATLTQASSQWSTRPADERFPSLESLHDAVSEHRAVASKATVPSKTLRAFQGSGGDVQIVGSAGIPAQLTHWSFGQLAIRAGAPASYVRNLPARLAVECLNHGLSNAHDEQNAALLIARDTDGARTVRGITGEGYTRIWNTDVTRRLLALASDGTWQPAPAASDGSRGLYASDHDMFAFMVDNERRIFERQPEGLSRGFFVWNSEVGATSWGICTFLYEFVCGNHRVWGAQGVAELRIRHTGKADERAFAELSAELTKYADSSAGELEQQIESARSFSLGADKDAVLDRVFGLRLPQLSRRRISEAYDLAETRVDWYGSPRSAWGLAGGLTELAKGLPFADDRVALDRAAGKVTALAF